MKSVSRVVALAFVALMPVTLVCARNSNLHRKGRMQTIHHPKWDIFAGYSYLAPTGTVNGEKARRPIDYGVDLQLSLLL